MLAARNLQRWLLQSGPEAVSASPEQLHTPSHTLPKWSSTWSYTQSLLDGQIDGQEAST